MKIHCMHRKKPSFLLGSLLMGLAVISLIMGNALFGALLVVLGGSIMVASFWGGYGHSISTSAAKDVQTVTSTDGLLRAVIKQRTDGRYQVEVWKKVYAPTQENSSDFQFVRQSSLAFTDSLAEAVDIASGYVGM